ncbi:hypothetical protein DVS77_18430 [Mycolicibacterium moriokaense]|nr:hypothetical protein DVS77_18430 [Mycolicibacterium moriokaense]
MCAGILLVVAATLPWSIHFGIGVPDSNGLVFALLLTATVLSLASVGVSCAGSLRSVSGDLQPRGLVKLRVGLNAPYLTLVLAFVALTIVDAIRYGGSTTLPAGVGPGAWFGLAGALLAAQPPITDALSDEHRMAPWTKSVRVLGVVAIVLASAAVAFNLYWRTRYVLPGGDAPFGSQNVVIIASTVIYGVLALVAVIVGTRWLFADTEGSRLAVIGLGASTLVAGFIVWILPVGRELDAYHGIAENTSTAGVGFEGYLAWVAAAAVFGPTTLRLTTASVFDRPAWLEAARKGLLLIAIWCGGSAICRVMDLVVTATLNLPYSPYDSMTLMAFDIVAAALAIWLRLNLKNTTIPSNVMTALSGVLLALTLSRTVVGVVLAPRIAGAVLVDSPVYGNTLAQQLTGTFDVVLCCVALAVVGVVLLTGQRNAPAKRPQPARVEARPIIGAPATAAAAPAPSGPTARPTIHRGQADTTQRIAMASGDATEQFASAAPRIHRSSGDATEQIASAAAATAALRIHHSSGHATEQIPSMEAVDRTQQIESAAPATPRIFRPLEESSERFAAGTTYGGTGGRHRVESHGAPDEPSDTQ